jgi:hypothetical protein
MENCADFPLEISERCLKNDEKLKRKLWQKCNNLAFKPLISH